MLWQKEPHSIYYALGPKGKPCHRLWQSEFTAVLTFASERVALSANGKAQLVLKCCYGGQLP